MNKTAEELRLALKKLEARGERELAAWEQRLAEAASELSRVTKANTEKLARVAELTRTQVIPLRLSVCDCGLFCYLLCRLGFYLSFFEPKHADARAAAPARVGIKRCTIQNGHGCGAEQVLVFACFVASARLYSNAGTVCGKSANSSSTSSNCRPRKWRCVCLLPIWFRSSCFRLLNLVTLQALKAEINMLRHKGGHIYTPMSRQ